jgi:putative ABC transport system permease protein
MIRNYLTIALRSLLKHKSFRAINLFGLTVGFTAVVLILLFVQDEVGYDRYHEDTDHIYRIYWNNDNPQTRTPHPMAQALVSDFPEVVSAVSLSPIWGAGLVKQTFSFRNLEKNIRYDERNVLSVDSTFFEVFPIRVLKGNVEKVLRSPGKILLSQSTAKKYFGDEDPIGKFLAINDDRNLAEVEGVYEDIPRQAHFHADILASYVHMKAVGDPESEYYTWADFGHFNYIRLTPGADPDKLESQLLTWSRKYIDFEDEEFNQLQAQGAGFKLQNIRDIHLHSNLRWELEPNGNIEYIYIMTAAAFLILIIASINFMNLTTAKSSERAKEIGIRKTLGAHQWQLAFQFVGESVLLTLMAVLMAGFIVELVLPLFNQISGKNIATEAISSSGMVLSVLGVGIVTGILAGLYPSFVLSSINTANILKGKFIRSQDGGRLNRILVVFQFMMASILVASTWIIQDQLSFVQNRHLGFDKNAVITVPVRTREVRRDMETIRNELLKIKGVVSVGASSNVPGSQFNQNPIYAVQDVSHRIDASFMYVDYDLLTTLGIQFQSGRNFSRDFESDRESAFILNEAAVQALQLKEGAGSEIVLEEDGDNIRGTVVGVVHDFHYQSLHKAIQPLVIQLRPYYNTVAIRISGNDVNATLASIEKLWMTLQPGFEFEYNFLDESLAAQYTAENKMGTVFSLFAAVAIVLACLGLLGLASLHYLQRKKEIGVRKVLGASPINLLMNLSKGYTTLILVATALATPLVWITMGLWLQNFNFKVTINPLIFVVTGVGILVLAWLTIGYLTLRAAAANPLDSLKEE